ncbi:hypothetical protein WN943_026829 [Citrus x changshan-huyou]
MQKPWATELALLLAIVFYGNSLIMICSILELFQPHDSLFSNKWRWRRRHELELFQQSMDYILTCIDNPRLLHTLGFVFCDNGKGRSRGLLIQARIVDCDLRMAVARARSTKQVAGA